MNYERGLRVKPGLCISLMENLKHWLLGLQGTYSKKCEVLWVLMVLVIMRTMVHRNTNNGPRLSSCIRMNLFTDA